MERCGTVLAVVSMMLVCACSNAGAPPTAGSSRESVSTVSAGVAKAAPSAAGALSAAPATDDVPPVGRKIIRHADLGIEVESPSEAERVAVSIIENLGGFVASSDRSLRSGVDAADSDDRATTVNMVLRVSSDRFMTAVAELEKLSSRTPDERVTSDDVTEEFIDLKARLGAERALEQQFLEILKQAHSVKDAIEVHTHLAEVRTSIEQIEGRQRFLEKQTATSSIKLSIAPKPPLVRPARFGFADSFARAGADLVNVSTAILHGAIRLIGVFTPILVLVIVPFGLLVRALFRRRRRTLAGA